MSPVWDFRQPDNAGIPIDIVSPQPIDQPDVVEQINRDTGAGGGKAIFEDPTNQLTNITAKSIITPGFSTIDRSILEYFNNIVVPTRDNTKNLEVRLAGGDRTILVWKQDLNSGRIKLPVMSINRTSITFNNNGKFSPPWVPVYRQFVDKDGTRLKLTYREWPALIEYQLSIWTERKQDLEFVLYQIVTRFNPIAEWGVDDAYMRGLVQAKMNNITYSSDMDIEAEKQPYHRADVNVAVEGWLPLQTYKIVPTILGKVGNFTESDGTIIETILSRPSNQ